MNPDTSSDDARFQLGVISGKIDLVLVQMASQAVATDARFSKVEERLGEIEEDLGSLKQSRSWLLGAGAVLGALAGTLGGLVGFGK